MTLAFIELKYPKLADTIEQRIDILGDFDSAMKPEHTAIEIRQMEKKHKLGSIFTFVVIGIINLAIYYFILLQKSKWSLPLILLLFILTGVIIFRFSKIIDFLNGFSDGKALGTIGLILAALGGLGEIYQVITLHVP